MIRNKSYSFRQRFIEALPFLFIYLRAQSVTRQAVGSSGNIFPASACSTAPVVFLNNTTIYLKIMAFL